MLEAQHDMAESQYDVARSFYPLFGGFGPLELEPRRVGGPTRHGALPMRRGALVLLPFWVFWCLWGGATSCWNLTRHGALPMRRDALFYPLFGAVRPLWGGATSCWRPNATWRAPYATWRARFALFRGDSDPWISSHVVLEAQRVMAHSQCDVEGRNTM